MLALTEARRKQSCVSAFHVGGAALRVAYFNGYLILQPLTSPCGN